MLKRRKPLFSKSHGIKPLPLKPSSRRSWGATPRRPISPDRWLDWLLDIAVSSALVVGAVALLVSLIVD